MADVNGTGGGAEVGDNSTGGITETLLGGATAVGTAADNALWIGGRIAQVVLILTAIGLLYVFRKPAKQIFLPFAERCGEMCRCRFLKRCCVRTFCCRCCPFNKSGDGGFQKLAEAQEILTLTLIAVSGVKKPKNFFIEVWSEPQEAASKVSRTHQQVVGDSSLGMEKLDIDWYGDEDRIIVQLVEFPQVGREKPIGEVQLSRSKILQYASEASKSKDDMNVGSRRFDVVKLDEHVAKMRKKKAKNPAPSNVVFSYMVTKAQERLGLGVAVPEDDALQLQNENAELKSQIADLRTQLTKSGTNSSASSLALSPGKTPREVIMGLVLRFEIRPTQAAPNVNFASFKQASFHEDP